MTTRVLIAGFHHETNTFAPTRADWFAFQRGETFPAYVQGAAMVERFADANISVGGFIQGARQRGWTLLPSCWAGATPSAHVTRDAFERIATVIVGDLRQAIGQGGVDAVYLDLHGAAVAEHLDDVEGELLAQVRATLGPDVPVVASLDMHANVTAQMLETADVLVGYRTYPHVDMAATGQLAASLLERCLRRGERQPLFVMRLPFLLPLNVQTTMAEPAASIYAFLRSLEEEYGVVVNFATGFPAADIAECGPAASIVVALQTIVSRNAAPLDMAIVTVGAMHSGQANNVIPDTAVLELSVRALTRDMRELLERRIKTLVTAQAESFGVRAQIDYRPGYAVLVNTPDETEFARQVATELVGAEKVVKQGPPLTASEDFSFMLEQVPGCYLIIGNGDGEGGCMVHNPGYDFNDSNLKIGAAYWSRLTETFLSEQLKQGQ